VSVTVQKATFSQANIITVG